MKRIAIALVMAAAAAACQGQSETPAPAPPEPKPIDASIAIAPIEIDAGDEAGSGSGSGSSSSETPEIANGGDSPDDAEALGKSATSAWQAVVDRDRYLARRNDKGVVEGRVGPAINPPAPVVDGGAPPAGPTYTWLIDDTEADGCLAIRVDFEDAAPKVDARVAVTGAWALDDDRHWYWRADTVTPLPDHPPPSEPAPPGHVIALAPAPADARAAARLADGNGAIVFQIMSPPRQDGDGWTIANEIGDPPVARLVLPGERPSYGGHDLRQPDERWQLKRGVYYWVKVGKVRRPATKPGADPADSLPIVRALIAPRRIP